MAASKRGSPTGTASVALALAATAAILGAGCGSSGTKPTAAPQVTTTTSSGSSKESTHPTTPGTVKGELRGTATDFCSAVAEGGKRISAAPKGQPIVAAAPIINEWIADLRRFAPATLPAEVAGLTTQLTEMSKQIQTGGIANNQAFANAINAALTSSDGKAIGAYAEGHCPNPSITTAP